MVISPLYKKLLRDMYAAKGQFIAVILVVLCGISEYVTIHCAFKNLLLTRDTYCNQYRLADLFFHVDRAPRSILNKLKAIPGIKEAYGRIVFDVTLDIPGNKDALVGRIISLPDKKIPILNDLHFVSGRYFRTGQENGVIVNPIFCEKNRIQLGDCLWANINDRKRPLRLIGTALSPEYIYTIRNAQEFVPNSKAFAICYVKESFAENALGYQEAINDITLAVESPELVESIKKKMEEILEPYGVLSKFKKEEQISYKFIADELKGLEVSATLVPAIFLGVAVLVIFIILSRVVSNQRTQIGILMALGYSKWQIFGHYLGYTVVIAILGSCAGLCTGNYLAGVMLDMYAQFYSFPVLQHKIYWDIFGGGILLALACCSLAGFVASWQIMDISPASAMNPPAPIAGKKILLERWTFLWKHLSFIWKMVMRNMFRHKARAAFIILGVALSCAILIQAFFGKDCMSALIHHEFSATQQQDIKVFFSNEKTTEAFYELKHIPDVTMVEPVYESAYEIKKGWRKKTVVITGLELTGRLRPLFDTEKRKIQLVEGGLIVSDKLAEILELKRGDKVIVKPLHRGKKEKTIVVKNVVQQYLGINSYMTLPSLSHLMDEGIIMNGALLKVKPGTIAKVHARLKKLPGVATVEFKETLIKNLEDAIGSSMYIMTGILTFFAGVIAFAIIYNSAIINIGERQRDLTTLKVLGLRDSEISRVIFNEYFLLVFLGIVVGLPLGKFLCVLLLNAYDTDLYRFPLAIYDSTYYRTVFAIAIFVLISQWACKRKLRRLDMVEVLKVRE